MKCRNKTQVVRQNGNNVKHDICAGCLALFSHDCAGGWFNRCNNSIPIKFGDTIKPGDPVKPK